MPALQGIPAGELTVEGSTSNPRQRRFARTHAILLRMEKTYAIFSANYLPNVGGVERYTHNLALSLAELGDRVIIVTSNVFDLPMREEVQDGIEVVRLPSHSLLRGRLPLPRKNRAYRDEIRRLAAEPLDYVVVNTRFYPHTLQGIRLAEAKGIRPVVIDHGSAHLTMGNALADVFVARYEHAITSFVKRHPADYYAVSQAGCTWLEHFGIASLGVLSNSIDAPEFRNSSSGRDYREELGLPSDAFIVSYAGRFIPEKGIRPLVESARILRDEPRVHYLLAGEGPLGEFIASQQLPNVHLLGKLASPDIAALLLASDAFCLPTRSEGFSTSLLESAACGTTPIITNVGGVQELMPNERYGCLLQQASAEEIAEAVLGLLRDPARNAQLGQNILHRVEQEFSWTKTAERVQLACKKAQRKRTDMEAGR